MKNRRLLHVRNMRMDQHRSEMAILETQLMDKDRQFQEQVQRVQSEYLVKKVRLVFYSHDERFEALLFSKL